MRNSPLYDVNLTLNNVVEKESSFNINGIIEEFVSYKVPCWSFFSQFQIFKEGFFNILDELLVSKFDVVGP
jgi:hypothetical protein